MKHAKLNKYVCLLALFAGCSIFLGSSVQGANTELVEFDSLSTDSHKVQAAYLQLTQQPQNLAKQQAYLQSFPQTAQQFNRVFNAGEGQQLFDGNDHIFKLEMMSLENIPQTFNLMINIASELTWEQNAPNYLQFVLMKIALNNPQEFAKQLVALSSAKRERLLGFLNAGHNGPAVGYNQLVYLLQRLKQTVAAEMLAAARIKP